MYRNLIIILASIFISLSADAMSHDKRIENAINSNDLFALDSIIKVVPKDSLSDFLYIYSQCLIGHYFHRPDISIPAFEELLQNHSQKLDLRRLIGAAMMFSMDLSSVGDNARAALVLSSILEANRKNLKSDVIKEKVQFIQKYSELAKYNPYAITFEKDTGYIPLKIVSVGKPEDKGLHIHLDNSYINGKRADITFDTGAAVNVISDSIALNFDLIPLDVETKISGASSQNGSFAIAKELKIGNITINDVPFYVMDMTANNKEADQYMNQITLF